MPEEAAIEVQKPKTKKRKLLQRAGTEPVATDDKASAQASLEPIASYPFGDLTLRIVRIDADGTLWLVANDLGIGLCLANIRQSLACLEADEKGVSTIYTLGGDQEVNIVSESGMYQLICMSRKKEAKAFKRWIFHDVLPAIRKTGRYERPGTALATGTDPQVLALMKQMAESQQELVSLKREGMEIERAKERLARFPPSWQIPKDQLRMKMDELIRTVALIKQCLEPTIILEINQVVRANHGIDFKIQRAKFQRLHGSAASIPTMIERYGHLRTVYDFMVSYYRDDLMAPPTMRLTEQLGNIAECLDEDDRRMQELMNFALGRDEGTES